MRGELSGAGGTAESVRRARGAGEPPLTPDQWAVWANRVLQEPILIANQGAHRSSARPLTVLFTILASTLYNSFVQMATNI